MTRDLLNQWFEYLCLGDDDHGNDEVVVPDIRDLPLEHDNARTHLLAKESRKTKSDSNLIHHHHHRHRHRLRLRREPVRSHQFYNRETTSVWNAPYISHEASTVATKYHKKIYNAHKPQRHQSLENFVDITSDDTTTVSGMNYKIIEGDTKLTMPVRKASVCWEDLCVDQDTAHGNGTDLSLCTATLANNKHNHSNHYHHDRMMMEEVEGTSIKFTSETIQARTPTILQSTVSEDQSSSSFSENTEVE